MGNQKLYPRLILIVSTIVFIPSQTFAAGSLCVFSKPSRINTGFESGSKQAQKDVREILESLGFNQQIPVFIGPVANAAAYPAQAGRSGIIAYNVEFLMKLYQINGWAPVSVLAHEVGHHIGNKQNSSNSWDRELNADEVSGCALAHMGASLVDTKVALSQGLPSDGSSTHPPTKLRLGTIERGWRTCKIRN